MSRIACKEVRRGEGEGEVQVSDDDERREGVIAQLPGLTAKWGQSALKGWKILLRKGDCSSGISLSWVYC